MTVQELSDTIDQIIDVLKRNHELLSPILTPRLDSLLGVMHQRPEFLQVLIASFNLDTTPEKILNQLQQAVEIEKTLIVGGLNDKLINILTKLKSRWVIMHTLSLLF